MEPHQANDEGLYDDGVPVEEIREIIRRQFPPAPKFEAPAAKWCRPRDVDFTADKKERSDTPADLLGPPRKLRSTDGISTGFRDFDRIVGGLHPGEVLTVAGLPSSGVSTLVQNIVRRVGIMTALSEEKHNGGGNFTRRSATVFFTLDTTITQIARRFISAETKMPLVGMSLQSPAANPLLPLAHARLTSANFELVDDYGMSVQDIVARCKSLARRCPINLIVIDRIDSIGVRGSGERESLATIMPVLQALARELNVPVLLSCTIDPSRVDVATQRARFNSLPPAVQLYADTVAILHRPDQWMPSMYSEVELTRSLSGGPDLQKGLEVLELEIVRQPIGGRDTARLVFDKALVRVDDIRWEDAE